MGAGFVASASADWDCEAGSVGCDVDGWGVCVSVLCAGCGREGVADKSDNKKKIAARVIQESRAAAKLSYAFVRQQTYDLPNDPGLIATMRCGGICLVLRIAWGYWPHGGDLKAKDGASGIGRLVVH